MENPFSISFTLKQHTPIIHFQHEQSGATLRATELKPKLDAYIMRKLLEEKGLAVESHLTRSVFHRHATQAFKDKEKTQPNPNYTPDWKAWLVGKGEAEHVSLDYKIGIIAQGLQNEVAMNPSTDNNGKWQTKFSAFFANMGKESESELKNFVMHDKVEVSITTSNPALKRLIEAHFPVFLMHTNFGTRQSKGFGSFFLHPEDIRYDLFQNTTLKYSFSINVEGYNSEFQKQEALFEGIDYFYRSMRSGINLKGTNREDKLYLKSLMAQFSFRPESNIQWDKKAIRYYFELGTDTYNRASKKRDEDSTFHYQTDKPNRLMRDMLGLSSQESWLAYRDAITKSNEEIGRFKSPILFKPIRMGDTFLIYFEGQMIPKKFFGQPFKISHKPKDGDRKPPKIMNTPSAEEFNLDEFLDFVFNQKNSIRQSIQPGSNGERETRLLTDLFTSLQKHH